jgi:glycosyltransferase involved in cell wall biosynthesis
MVQPYYWLWQLLAYFYLKKHQLHRSVDLIHHVTFSTFRHTSFLYLLNKPFIFGSVGGGESAPLKLTFSCGGLKNTIFDLIRLITNHVANALPWHQGLYQKAHVLVAATKETAQFFPNNCKRKTIIATNIGVPDFLDIKKQDHTPCSSPVKLLYVGRFIYWKGITLLLKALKECKKNGVSFELTLIGEGSEKSDWQKLAQKLGIASSITWENWMSREDLTTYYQQADYFVFPSLHDSGGNVLVEAMANALPVICFDLGGPGILINNTCGVVVKARHKSTQNVINDLAGAIEMVAGAPKLREMLSYGALTQVHSYTWQALYERVYGFALPRLAP